MGSSTTYVIVAVLPDESNPSPLSSLATVRFLIDFKSPHLRVSNS